MAPVRSGCWQIKHIPFKFHSTTDTYDFYATKSDLFRVKRCNKWVVIVMQVNKIVLQNVDGAKVTMEMVST